MVDLTGTIIAKDDDVETVMVKPKMPIDKYMNEVSKNFDVNKVVPYEENMQLPEEGMPENISAPEVLPNGQPVPLEGVQDIEQMSLPDANSEVGDESVNREPAGKFVIDRSMVPPLKNRMDKRQEEIKAKEQKKPYIPTDKVSPVKVQPFVVADKNAEMSIKKFQEDPEKLRRIELAKEEAAKQAKIAGSKYALTGEQQKILEDAQAEDNAVKRLQALQQKAETDIQDIEDAIAKNNIQDFTPKERQNMLGNALWVIASAVGGYAGKLPLVMQEWNKELDRRTNYLIKMSDLAKAGKIKNNALLEKLKDKSKGMIKDYQYKIILHQLEQEKTLAKSPQAAGKYAQIQEQIKADALKNQQDIAKEAFANKQKQNLEDLEQGGTVAIEQDGLAASLTRDKFAGKNAQFALPDPRKQKDGKARAFNMQPYFTNAQEFKKFKEVMESDRMLYKMANQALRIRDNIGNFGGPLAKMTDPKQRDQVQKLQLLAKDMQTISRKSMNLGVPSAFDYKLVDSIMSTAITDPFGLQKTQLKYQIEKADNKAKEIEISKRLPRQVYFHESVK